MDPDEKVLSYGDVLIRRSDAELLTGPFWLNDQVRAARLEPMLPLCCMTESSVLVTLPSCTQIISFYFEWLAREGQPTADALLLSGATTFLLLHGSTCRRSLYSLRIHAAHS